jgi:hypothetical protein
VGDSNCGNAGDFDDWQSGDLKYAGLATPSIQFSTRSFVDAMWKLCKTGEQLCRSALGSTGGHKRGLISNPDQARFTRTAGAFDPVFHFSTAPTVTAVLIVFDLI